MADKKKAGSTKRFGSRYGRKLKEKVAEVEAGHRGRHKCPYCGKNNARRLAAGIWTCKSCNVKFTGRAYSIGKKAISNVGVEEEPVEEEVEDEELEREELEGKKTPEEESEDSEEEVENGKL